MTDFIKKMKYDTGFQTLVLTIVSGFCLALSFWKDLWFNPAWIAILLSGIPIVTGALRGLIREVDVTADVLVAIALVSAVMIGEYFAAGEVAFIMQLGKVLEDKTAEKSHRNLQALIDLTPTKARLRTANGDIEIKVSDIKLGDRLLILPGESIPIDGKIISGSTTIDQAIITGESMPVDKVELDDVYQGTLNQQGVIEIEATRIGEASTLKKMIRLVAEAEDNKAPIVRIADKWARRLVPVALIMSLLILIFTRDFTRAVTALVVFCPCSLILATPTAMVAAIGNATKKGILIKSGTALEAMAKVDTFVFDKTGTLTEGKIKVDEIVLFDYAEQIPHDATIEFISAIASAEKFSEHPIGKAIREYAFLHGVSADDPESFEMQIGKGVVAIVDGKRIAIGERAVLSTLEKQLEGVATQIQTYQSKGKTVLPVSIENQLKGLVLISDQIKVDARQAIEQLKINGIKHVAMLTGDHERVANEIGRQMDIVDIYASQLPENKVSAIKSMREKGLNIAMIGDGINDAPALATASVGIVMGAIGSDIAIEASDIALMNDDISQLPFLLRLSQKTRNRIVFNIVISMIINFGAIILAGFGILNPVTAAIVHNFGSVFVVVNSSLLLSYK